MLCLSIKLEMLFHKTVIPPPATGTIESKRMDSLRSGYGLLMKRSAILRLGAEWRSKITVERSSGCSKWEGASFDCGHMCRVDVKMG
jgi:hypothetical protein